MIKLWTKNRNVEKGAGFFISINQYLNRKPNDDIWSFQVYIVHESNISKYICRVEFGKSHADLSFRPTELSKFLLFNSVHSSGNMSLMDGKVEFVGEFSGILPLKGQLIINGMKKEKFIADQIDVNTESLYQNEWEFTAIKGKKNMRYRINSNGISEIGEIEEIEES